MEGFPLFDVNSTHLQKIFRKLEYQSYLNLRQTCQQVDDFLHNNRNISINLDDSFFICFNKGHLTLSLLREPTKVINIESLFATRLATLQITYRLSSVEAFSNLMEKHRVTFRELIISDSSQLTKEDCTTLIRILKPIEIHLESWESDRFEAIFELKKLTSVVLLIDAEVVVDSVQKLLPTCENIDIRVPLQSTNQLQLFRTVLQLLLSNPWDSLHEFNLCVIWETESELSKEQIMGQMSDIHFKTWEERNNRIDVWIDLPAHFSSKSSCKMILNSRHNTVGRIRFIQEKE